MAASYWWLNVYQMSQDGNGKLMLEKWLPSVNRVLDGMLLYGPNKRSQALRQFAEGVKLVEQILDVEELYVLSGYRFHLGEELVHEHHIDRRLVELIRRMHNQIGGEDMRKIKARLPPCVRKHLD